MKNVSRIKLPLFCFLISTGAPALLSAEAALPTNVTIITQDDLVNRPYFSVGDALAGVPSLKVERDGTRGSRTRVKMRGLSSSQDALVLLDGRPLTHEFDGDVDLTQIPLSMVERIEITRGGAAVSYSGEAVGGAINIVTNRPAEKGLDARIRTGVGRNGVKHSAGKFTGRSNIGDLTYDASKEASGGFMDNEDYATTNHFANFTRSFKGKGFWGAEYFYHESRLGVPNGTLVPLERWNGIHEQTSATLLPQRTQFAQHGRVFAAFPLLAGGTTYATFTHSYRHLDDRATRGGLVLRDQDNRSSIMDFSWKGKHVETGVQSEQLKREIFPEPTREVFQNNAYLLGKWRGNHWMLAPGLRLDHRSKTGNFVVPRLALLYSPDKHWLFSSTAQRAHRFPNFDELYLASATINNPDLRDERSRSFDAGAAWTPTERLEFKVTGFLVRVDDLIAADQANRLANGGTEKSRGLETEISLRGSQDSFVQKFDLSAHWTAQQSQRSLPGRPANADSAMTPRHLVFLKLDRHLKHRALFTNELRYQSKQFDQDNRQGVSTPAFYVWNLRYSLKILAADIYFEVDNVNRRRYAESISHFNAANGTPSITLNPQPDRTYWLGVAMRFKN